MALNESENEIILRRQMVENQIRHRGIKDERVLTIMSNLPRQLFIPKENRHEAYLDQPVQIGDGQTISQPYMVALMTEALHIEPQDEVLEIGTGCGYQTAILASLCRKVFTIEVLEELSLAARQPLESLGIDNVHYHIGNGRKGWPDHREFDAILVAAASPGIPPHLLAQLKDGSRMVIPVDDSQGQKLLLVKKHGAAFESKNICWCRFVRLIDD